MVDFIPLFFIINMESEIERSARISRVYKEANAWDAALRDYKTKFKPKMSIPQTPSARSTSVPAASSTKPSGGSFFQSCTTLEKEEEHNELALSPLQFTVTTPLNCVPNPKLVVNATRFFITFQYPEEIKSETPSILSLVLIGHTETLSTEGSQQGWGRVASARQMLEMEYVLINGVYSGCLRDKDDTITMTYENDGMLIMSVTIPKWRIVSFVSPVSGKGEAIPTWTVAVLPVLYCGRFATLGVVTTRRGHAEDTVAESAPVAGEGNKKLTFGSHDILVSVGGDGVAHEICNGISRRNKFGALPLQFRQRAQPKNDSSAPQSLQAKRDAEDKEQQMAREHVNEIWSQVPNEDPTGHYVVPSEVLEQTPYVALVAAGSGCALAKEVEVENYIVSALSLIHVRPQVMDIFRMDPFDVPEKIIKASTDRYVKTEADKKTVALRNSIEGSTAFAKAADTPLRFGMLALMFACVNEIDKGSEGMRWMGNTRFAVKTAAMIVSGVPLYRVYFRYATDTFYQPEVRGPNRNLHFGKSYTKESTPADGCTDWQVSPSSRVAFMSINNIRLVARDVNFAPYARPSDGFLDSLSVGVAEYDSSDPTFRSKIRRRDALDFFGQTETGAHVNENLATYGKCRRVQVIPIDGNVMADGEVCSKTGITVTPVQKALYVLSSPSMNWSN
eukprot:GILJ01016463.1.p1 GENE.GILJ01016463.1~~GILJ01016463.1.p1  ORF type:complete len:726 (-),score=88.51 GILJ01016463.1:113-2137(-)